MINVDNGDDSDDSDDSETAVTDTDNSNSRVGAIFRQDLANGGQFRFHFETALGSGPIN